MAANVRNTISLDASRFERGANAVQRGITRMERKLTLDWKRAARIARRAAMALAAGIVAISVAVGEGIRRVLSYADQIRNLGKNTGAAVSDLAVLVQAFEDADQKVENLSNRMRDWQVRLAEAREGSEKVLGPLRMLGFSLEEIERMNPGQQLMTVGKAIAALEDPTRRTATAVALFGGNAPRALAAFGNIESAARAIGSQAQLLEKNAELFSSAADILGRAGLKMRGFFVGVADRVVPAIMPLLRQMDEADFAEQGQKFGDGIARGARILQGLLKEGKLGEAFAETLKVAAKSFLNTIVQGWIAVVQGIAAALSEVAIDFGTRILKTIEGVTGSDKVPKAVTDVGKKAPPISPLGALIRVISTGTNDLDQAEERRSAAPLADRIALAMSNAIAAAGDVEIFDAEEARNRLKDILKDAFEDGAPEGDGDGGERGAGFGEEGSEGGGAQGPGVSSLAKIGGGGGIGPGGGGIESVMRESNDYLRDISINTARLAKMDRGSVGPNNEFSGEVLI